MTKPFSELAGQEKASEIIRWILVPAASILAVAVLGMAAHLTMPPRMAQLPGTPPPSNFQRFAVVRIASATMAAAFVMAGSFTAPRKRATVALALAGGWILYSCLIHVVVHLGRGKTQWLDFGLAIVAAACGVAAVFRAERAATVHKL